VGNPNKRKGDDAELKTLKWLKANGFPNTWKTRAGWDDDRGDVLVPHPLPGHAPVVVQVKDVAAPAWPKWHGQVADQVRNAQAAFGVILHKRRGSANPGDWNVVITGDQFIALLNGLGYHDPLPLPTETEDVPCS